MYDILSLFSVLYPHLSRTTVRQFSPRGHRIACDDGSGQYAKFSRWTSGRRELPDGPTLFQCWGTICWVFFSTYLLDPESLYNATTVSKSGESTYGFRVFSRLHMVKRYRV